MRANKERKRNKEITRKKSNEPVPILFLCSPGWVCNCSEALLRDNCSKIKITLINRVIYTYVNFVHLDTKSSEKTLSPEEKLCITMGLLRTFRTR